MKTAPCSRPLRVLHVLKSSFPRVTGYTVRSKYIVDTQRRDGIDPIVVTSPYYPLWEGSRVDAVLDGTHYFRVRPGLQDAFFAGWDRWEASRWGGQVDGNRQGAARFGQTPTQMRSAPRAGDAGGFLGLVGDHAAAVAGALWRRRFERALDRIVLRTQPDLVHAHSPYECGLPALRIARRYRLPLVYEVRGIWEESRVAQEGEAWRDTRIYRWQREAESAVMIQANAVVCISTQLRQEILARGVPDSRVVVVPNAVDPSVFRPLSAATADVPEEIRDVRRRLKGLTLGYVGNLRTLEGVDELVRGAAELVRRGREVSLLVVGSGDGGEGLKVLARDLGIGDRAVFTGQVPHHQIALYYDLIDVFVVSRPALRVTNLVTPLKPLEAMAMARPLVVSDLPALRELVIEDDTGLFYPPGDVAKLADVCARLLDDAALRRRLGEKARNWVLENRTWPIVLRGLYPVYKSLLGPTFTESSCALQSL